MRLLRSFIPVNRRALLAFVLAALGMQALVPAGLMLAPAAEHGAAIILCPQTHPLARALGAKADASDSSDASMAALHAAMGHGSMDHAAMGHAPAPEDDSAPATSSGSYGQTCAYAGAALAGLLPDRTEPPVPLAAQTDSAPAPLQPLGLATPAHLRPPLRAPPALI
jgi:hypothetical protein